MSTLNIPEAKKKGEKKELVTLICERLKMEKSSPLSDETQEIIAMAILIYSCFSPAEKLEARPLRDHYYSLASEGDQILSNADLKLHEYPSFVDRKHGFFSSHPDKALSKEAYLETVKESTEYARNFAKSIKITRGRDPTHDLVRKLVRLLLEARKLNELPITLTKNTDCSAGRPNNYSGQTINFIEETLKLLSIKIPNQTLGDMIRAIRKDMV